MDASVDVSDSDISKVVGSEFYISERDFLIIITTVFEDLGCLDSFIF